MQRVLGIYVKFPAPGTVKTRLAAELGTLAATELYTAFLRDLAARFRQTADRRFLCFSPRTKEAETWFRELGGAEYDLWPQPAGSLEPRLGDFFQFAAGQGATATVAIGSDSPTLPVRSLEEAFDQLQSRDCVLGPATDGGYYLIGLQKPLPIFTGIDWSTSQVLRQTVDRISQLPATLGLLPPWYDVDTPADLELLRGHLNGILLADDPLQHTLPETYRIIGKLLR